MEGFITFQIEKEQAVYKKFFVYKRQKYPFNFDLIKQNSIYFNDKQHLYADVNEIQLLSDSEEEIIDISDDTIRNFISICQNDECKINISYMIDLQFLSIKYGVTQLTTKINKYFNENWDEQALNSLLFKSKFSSKNKNFYEEKWQKNFFDSSKEEDFIGKNLNKFIDQESLLLLPIPIIYRIFTKFFSIKTKTVKINSFIDFLFKCLDKYGKEASILFSQIDFKQQKIEVINKLIREYKDIFDFNMINSTLTETTIQLTSELRKLKEEYDRSLSEMKFMYNKQKEELEQIKIEEEKQSNERKNHLLKEIESLREESKKAKESFKQEIETFRNESKKEKDIFQQEIESLREESKIAKESFRQEIESLREANKKAKELFQQEIETLRKESKKEKEIFQQEIESLRNESNKTKEMFQQKIQKSFSEMKIVNDEYKKNIEQIKIEVEKQSEERKIYLQQETDRIKNDIAKPKEIFQQEINQFRNEMDQTVKKFKEDGKIDIFKSIIDPKYFINLSENIKTGIIKEILLDLSNINEKSMKEYRGLIKQVFILNNFIETINYSNNEDEKIHFIQRNINNFVFD